MRLCVKLGFNYSLPSLVISPGGRTFRSSSKWWQLWHLDLYHHAIFLLFKEMQLLRESKLSIGVPDPPGPQFNSSLKRHLAVF